MSHRQARSTPSLPTITPPTYNGDPSTLPAFFDEIERYAKVKMVNNREKISYVSAIAVTDRDYLKWKHIASYCDGNWHMFKDEIMSEYRELAAYETSCRRSWGVGKGNSRVNHLVVEKEEVQREKKFEAKLDFEDDSEDESDSYTDSDSESEGSDSDVSTFSNSDDTSHDEANNSDDEDMFNEGDTNKLIHSQAYFEQIESYRRYQKHMAKRRGRHASHRSRMALR